MDKGDDKMAVGKIQRVSVTDQIYDILVKKIADGEWKTGEKIPSEIELAQQLGVSRVSLKMALQKLNTMGVTETRVGEGTFVCDFHLKTYFSELTNSKILDLDVNQINEFRIMLEYCAMHLIIRKPEQPEMLKKLEEIYQAMVAAIESGDDAQYNQQHYRFHRTICKMSCNELFLQLYDSMGGTFFETYKANSEKTWKTLGREESIRHHREVLDAICSRDAQWVARLQDDLLADEHIRA